MVMVTPHKAVLLETQLFFSDMLETSLKVRPKKTKVTNEIHEIAKIIYPERMTVCINRDI